jgi:hypothetical protein
MRAVYSQRSGAPSLQIVRTGEGEQSRDSCGCFVDCRHDVVGRGLMNHVARAAHAVKHALFNLAMQSA